MMGNFNYPGIGWRGEHSSGASVEAVRFKECVEDNFFTQYVNSPTRDDNILDLVLCNEPELDERIWRSLIAWQKVTIT